MTRWPAYAAALWALVFAAFHFIWAAGWYPGLDAEAARAAFAVPWKLAYDIVAGVLCLVAVPVVLAPVMPWGARLPRRMMHALAVIGTAVLALRAVASVVQSAWLLAAGRFRADLFLPWEPWFYLGAALFVAATWMARRPARRAG